MSFEARYSGRDDWEAIDLDFLQWLLRSNYQEEHIGDLLHCLDEGVTIPLPDNSAEVRATNVFAEILAAR